VAAKRKRKLTDKPSDDHALRAAYLELYAARNARKRLSRIRSELGIKLNTLDRWMQDDAFVQSIDDIDSRRLKAAEGLATTLWPEIVERQAALATGDIPAPPPEPDKNAPDYAYQCRMIQAGYQAACAQAIKMSTRAAEMIGKYLHQLQDRTGVNVYGADGVEVFGKLSDKHTPEELAAEMLRREEILERYRKRLEEQGDRHSGSKAEPRGGEAGEGA
jgi:hypothetical protein